MRGFAFVVSLLLLASPAFAQWATNQPAGLTTFIDRQWTAGDQVQATALSGTDHAGMAWFAGDGPGPVSQSPIINTPSAISTIIGQTVPLPPDSNSTVMAIKYPSGWPAAYRPFGLFASIAAQKQYYVSMYVFEPTGFNSNGNQIKWLKFQSTGNHFFMLSANDTTDYRALWMALQGGPSTGYFGNDPNMSGALQKLTYPPQGTGSGWWLSNQGAWHLIEFYVQTETTPGVSGDGIFKSWFDSTLINSWANINFNAASGYPNGFDILSFEPYYGGGGSNAPSDQYLICGRLLVATSTSAGATNTSISPAAASLAFTGATSTIARTGNISIAPAAVSLHFSPSTSTVSNTATQSGIYPAITTVRRNLHRQIQRTLKRQ